VFVSTIIMLYVSFLDLHSWSVVQRTSIFLRIKNKMLCVLVVCSH